MVMVSLGYFHKFSENIPIIRLKVKKSFNYDAFLLL